MELLSAYAVGRAKSWLARISGGALVFWAVAGLAVRSWLPPTRGCAGARGSAGMWCQGNRFDVVALCVYGVLAIAAAVGSTLVAAAASAPVVRFLAGTSWPVARGLGRWTAWRVRRHRRVFKKLLAADPVAQGTSAPAQPAATPPAPARPASDLARLTLDRARGRRRRYPRELLIAPTRIGNSLAAMTERVTGRHGWDLATCWELIDLALPDQLSGRLRADSDRLTTRGQNLLWAVLTCLVAAVGLGVTVWRDDGGALVLGAFLTAALGAALAVFLLFRGLCAAVDVYCDSVEAVLVAARADIYRVAGWPAPATPAEEHERGTALSGYLSRRGLQAPDTRFVVPSEPEPATAPALTTPPAAPAATLPNQSENHFGPAPSGQAAP
ncbi:hypothetical protein [Streptomyces sp. HUAS TT20]|uniref:hypothetical protein n=1 Tax=Streptomyces sp. HUAS TT20 TaxID=3447509 RepID=UPI0021DAB2E4|nr:hypothetical protein [Streptomyces sp. HUAS 15-9]UXY29678.1 hypothetical protein N8I87_26040 [Streptomyces sp. HUAS 15-9]